MFSKHVASDYVMIIQADCVTFVPSYYKVHHMKRIHWLSLFLGMLITLALVSACNSWRSNAVAPERVTAPKIIADTSSPYDNDDNARQANQTIVYKKLPPEARAVIDTIKARGSFPFAQDGKAFQNRERLLPQQPRGYYQEYTVVTPNANNRGARRIVAGKGSTGDVASANEFYYTADHYRSFYRVKE